MKAILTYHSIDGTGSVISTPEEVFERHVAFLASGKVRVVPLAEIAAAPATAPALAVTFDDGFRSFGDFAWPRLRDAGVPATVFLVPDRMGRDNAWGDREEPGVPTLPLLDWGAAGRIAEEGAELGAHGTAHARLDRLPESGLDDEIGACGDLIEESTGRRPASFAYAYGVATDAAAARVGQAYDRACSTELRCVAGPEESWFLPRLDAFYLRRPGRLESFGTPGFRRWLALRGLLRRLRRRGRGETPNAHKGRRAGDRMPRAGGGVV